MDILNTSQIRNNVCYTIDNRRWVVKFSPLLALFSLLFLLSSLNASEKPRVFITDSDSWEMSGGFATSDGVGTGASRGGARPQTGEIMKTFGERCPGITVTINQEKADYVVLLDHEGGKGGLMRDNKVAVFNRDGDMIHSGSTRSLGNAVKDACQAVASAPVVLREERRSSFPTNTGGASVSLISSAQRVEPATVVIKSTPEGAEITIDGNFVGSTPSTLQLTPGDHEIVVQKKEESLRSVGVGKERIPVNWMWRRTLTVNPGSIITVDATLERKQ